MLKISLSLVLLSMMGLWGEMILMSMILFFFFFFKSAMDSVPLWMIELDDIGIVLINLSFWVVILSILSSVKIKFNQKLSSFFLFVTIMLLIFLIYSFSMSDFLMFYLMFESCLIPILVMILGWGYQPERMKAGIYMLFYTLFGSLPLFYIIMKMINMMGSGFMNGYMTFSGGNIVLVCLITAFLVKFPMYSVHLWLLKAHVEAPVAGSMILAGVLLKLGGYGLIRVMSCFNSEISFKPLIFSLSLWGAILVSLNCLRFMDMKLLIASSSVVHMSGCILGLFSMSEYGLKGCILMMVAHGLCSSGLFFLANMVYERTNSRSMIINKGLLNMMPSMSLWWFLLIAVNMAAPPSISLMSEIMILLSVISWSKYSILYLMLLGFFSAAYSLFLFSLSQHGNFVKMKSGMQSGKMMEYLVVFLHWAPLNILICCYMFFF